MDVSSNLVFEALKKVLTLDATKVSSIEVDVFSLVDKLIIWHLGYLAVSVSIVLATGVLFYFFSVKPLKDKLESQESKIENLKQELKNEIGNKIVESEKTLHTHINSAITNSLSEIEESKKDFDKKLKKLEANLVMDNYRIEAVALDTKGEFAFAISSYISSCRVGLPYEDYFLGIKLTLDDIYLELEKIILVESEYYKYIHESLVEFLTMISIDFKKVEAIDKQIEKYKFLRLKSKNFFDAKNEIITKSEEALKKQKK